MPPTKKQQPEPIGSQQQGPEPQVTVITSEPCKDQLQATVITSKNCKDDLDHAPGITSESCKESREQQRKRSQSELLDHESLSSCGARDSVNLENYGITRVKQQSLSEGLDQITRDSDLRHTK